MILEGLVTTLSPQGEVNLAPMGAVVDSALDAFVLRPFRTANTYQNLRHHPQAVFHVTDDVELIARAALNQLSELPPLRPAEQVAGEILKNCCRWFELTATDWDDSEDRARVMMRVVHTGHVRDFFGLNRAKHAVLEATILATRLHLLSSEFVTAEINRWQPLIDKTAGPQELAAWQFVCDFIRNQTKSDSSISPL
ncbi:DUF447 family protein [bacterium]|nr:DUF447 family protein [bacterium]